MYVNLNTSLQEAGLTSVLNKPVPKPRPRVSIPTDEKPPVTTPIPPPRLNNVAGTLDSLPFYRKNIEELIKENRPQKEKFQAACSVMRVQCSLNSKYESIELWDLLERNKGQEVRKIPQAFTILEKYATNLLKDVADRHPSWQSVNFQSNAYQSKVKFMVGALQILKSLGYTEENYNNHGDIIGLAYPAGTLPNSRIVLDIAVDLIIAQFEVEAMIMGEHPRANELQTIEDVPSVYFPSSDLPRHTVTGNEVFDEDSMSYALNKTAIYDIPPPLPPKKVPVVPEQTPTKYKESMGSDISTGSISPQVIQCVNCTAMIDLGSRFCNQCGSPMKARPSETRPPETRPSETRPSEHDEQIRRNSQFLETMSIGSDDDAFVHIDAGWNCEHCTLLNTPDTNICALCCRTSTSRRGNTKMKPDSKTAGEPGLQEEDILEIKKRRDHEIQMKHQKEQEEQQLKKEFMIHEQSKIKEDGQMLVTLMKLSENYGYTVEECFISQKYLNNLNPQLVLNWLRNDWLILINEVVILCNDKFEKDESVGAMSQGEARQLLLQADGDKMEAVKAYDEKRKKQINQLADLDELFGRKYILNALFEADGDEKKARQILHKKQLDILYKSLHKKIITEDYERIKDVNIPKEVKQRMIVAEIGVSWLRADFAFRLLERGVPDIDEILQVIRENTHYDYEQCVKFFSHYCELCCSECSHNNTFVSWHCGCAMCHDCCCYHIKYTITDKHIRYLVCPFCSQPDIEDINIDIHQYFAMLETQINSLIGRGKLEQKIKEIFDKKVFEFFMKKKENFRFCIKCYNGFIWDDVHQIRMQCNFCKAYMCFLCKTEWMEQHEGITCEQFKEWKDNNDPNKQEKGVQELLDGRDIECPSCTVKFVLARGGCMHFKCPECLYDFCGGCDQPFKRAELCRADPSCAKKGFHTHHPRDCLYYLRDFEVGELEELLNNHQVELKKEYPPEMNGQDNPTCGVMLQKEEADHHIDEACGEPAPNNMAGLCQNHYKEYLGVLINNNGIDPAEVMDAAKLNTVLGRSFKERLEQNNGESDEDYRARLLTYVLEQAPFQQRKKVRNRPQNNIAPAGAAAVAAAPAPPPPPPMVVDVANEPLYIDLPVAVPP